MAEPPPASRPIFEMECIRITPEMARDGLKRWGPGRPIRPAVVMRYIEELRRGLGQPGGLGGTWPPVPLDRGEEG